MAVHPCFTGPTVELVTESGLVLAGIRTNTANGNPPIGSVGPNVPEGFGDTHVMYSAAYPPMDVQNWNGWPLGWETPLWNGAVHQRLVSTLWTCIDLNTRQLASFPTFGIKGLDVVPLPEWSRNPEPDTYSDWMEACKQIFNTLQAEGECLLWCVGRYSSGMVARFVVLNPAWINVEKVDGVLEYSLAGQALERKDVCHIKYQSMPGNLRGISPLSWVAQSIIGAAAMERYASELAANGGIPWGIIKTARHLNKDDAEALQKRWVDASRNRAGGPAVLSGGIELDTVTINPRDLMLLEMRIFDETRIASALGVPPFLVGLPQPEGLTYANATSLFDFHWRATLRTLAKAVASAVSAWALPRGTDMEFNRDAYVQATPAERAATYQTLFNIVDEKGNRAITVDEIRMAERYLPNTPTPELETQGEVVA